MLDLHQSFQEIQSCGPVYQKYKRGLDTKGGENLCSPQNLLALFVLKLCLSLTHLSLVASWKKM